MTGFSAGEAFPQLKLVHVMWHFYCLVDFYGRYMCEWLIDMVMDIDMVVVMANGYNNMQNYFMTKNLPSLTYLIDQVPQH